MSSLDSRDILEASYTDTVQVGITDVAGTSVVYVSIGGRIVCLDHEAARALCRRMDQIAKLMNYM